MLSVLIPSRNEPYLNRTIDEVLTKAAGPVECVVLLDGAPPTEPLPVDKRIVVLVNEQPAGIGAASWAMANAAQGDYIMKLDAHCMLAQGYDAQLIADCGENDLLVPSRYQLKGDTWTRGYGPIDYLYLTYPWLAEPQFGAGMHGKKWQGLDGVSAGYFWPEHARAGIALDDIMTFQGSLFFMRRQRFIDLGGVDSRYWLWQEALSIGMKVWLSGGRCMVDKGTWYAHLHKGKLYGRGYFVSKRREHASNVHSADLWMNDKWEHPLKVRDMRWFVNHFWPIPTWPEDWDNPRYQAEFVYPERAKDGR